MSIEEINAQIRAHREEIIRLQALLPKISLTVSVDILRKEEEVSAITQNDFFQELRRQARELKQNRS